MAKTYLHIQGWALYHPKTRSETIAGLSIAVTSTSQNIAIAPAASINTAMLAFAVDIAAPVLSAETVEILAEGLSVELLEAITGIREVFTGGSEVDAIVGETKALDISFGTAVRNATRVAEGSAGGTEALSVSIKPNR